MTGAGIDPWPQAHTYGDYTTAPPLHNYIIEIFVTIFGGNKKKHWRYSFTVKTGGDVIFFLQNIYVMDIVNKFCFVFVEHPV